MAATTQPPTQPMTAEELLRLPNDGKRYQLVRGELRTMSPPDFRHGEIAGNIYAALRAYVRSKGLGRTSVGDPGFLLARNPDTVLAPDAAFLSADQAPPGDLPRGFWKGAPTLAVEVVSPNDTAYEVEEKVEDWLALGCAMVVVVSDKRRTVTVHRPGQSPRILRGNDIFDGEDVVPGFQLPLPEIFA